MTRPSLLFAVLLLSGCEHPPAPDAERMVGAWVVVDFHSPKADEDKGQLFNRLHITGETWSQQFQGDRFEDFEYRIDATKSPKELDLIYTAADGRRLVVRAIYEMPDDDHLRLCVGSPPVARTRGGVCERTESVRPTAFAPTAGPLIVYRRKPSH
jgi:uncharacterized protein (TIGR03067 family)